MWRAGRQTLPSPRLPIWKISYRSFDLGFSIVKLAQGPKNLMRCFIVIGASCSPQGSCGVIDRAEGTFEIGSS